jgi:hypothetical protein
MHQTTPTLTYDEAINEIANHVLAFICPWDSKNSSDVKYFFSLAHTSMADPQADLDELCASIM